MKYSSVAIAAVAALVAGAQGHTVAVNHYDVQNVTGVLHLPIQGRNAPLPHLVRGAGTGILTLSNNLSSYLAKVSVGTPGQQLTLQIDTGSSDAWFPAFDSDSCSQGNCNHGSFNSSSSSTFQTTDHDFHVHYADNTGATGKYFTDVIQVGDDGLSLPSLTMGLGTKTNISAGILGVGLVGNEAVKSNESYPNLPISLADSGVISSAAYSLWLNDLDASGGSLLFGGVDTEKYHGNLTRLKLLPSPWRKNKTKIVEFLVPLTSVTASSSSGTDRLGSSEFPILGVLDSGTTMTYVPGDLLLQIYQLAGVEMTGLLKGTLPCDAANGQGTLTFGFGGPSGASIKVDMSELVLPAALDFTFPSGPNMGKKVCGFGISQIDLPVYLFGDTFLRSAYVVYDLVNKEVAMGQTIFNATKTNVVPFPSAGAVIPNSAPAPSQDALTSGLVTTAPGTLSARRGFLTSTAPALKGGQSWPALVIMGAAVFVACS